MIIDIANTTPSNTLTVEHILAGDIQRRFLFEYFADLSDQSCGWGISYIQWLEISKDIVHQGFTKYKCGPKAVKIAKDELYGYEIEKV